jgi:hypothetical protein
MFADKNAIAKEHMEKNGVQFFDTQKAILSRRTQDPTVFADLAIHACNPGKNSLPIFLVKRILHILAVSKRDGLPQQSIEDTSSNHESKDDTKLKKKRSIRNVRD